MVRAPKQRHSCFRRQRLEFHQRWTSIQHHAGHRITSKLRLAPISWAPALCQAPYWILCIHYHLYIFFPAPLWDEVGAVIFLLVREETSSSASERLHVLLHCRETVCISLGKKRDLLVTSKVPSNLKSLWFLWIRNKDETYPELSRAEEKEREREYE